MSKTSLYLLDGVAENLRVLLGSNLPWLTNARHQAFKFANTVDGSKLYVPNVYQLDGEYLTTTPNNKIKGECFFIFGNSSLDTNRLLNSSVSIIFNFNMKLIDDTKDEIFIEELIDNVIQVLFFQNLNLNFSQISIIFLVLSLTILICEIPTGILTDFHGRKKSIIIYFVKYCHL